jgi:hypothetical protein
MSEAGSSLDQSSQPTPDSSLVMPTPLFSRYDQSDRPFDARRTTIPSPIDVGATMPFPSRSHTVPERATARHPEPPTPLFSTTQPINGNQAPTVPLLPHAMPEHPPEGSPFQHRTTRGRLLAFFGFGTGPELRERKDLMSLIWNLGFNGAQVC